MDSILIPGVGKEMCNIMKSAEDTLMHNMRQLKEQREPDSITGVRLSVTHQTCLPIQQVYARSINTSLQITVWPRTESKVVLL